MVWELVKDPFLSEALLSHRNLETCRAWMFTSFGASQCSCTFPAASSNWKRKPLSPLSAEDLAIWAMVETLLWCCNPICLIPTSTAYASEFCLKSEVYSFRFRCAFAPNLWFWCICKEEHGTVVMYIFLSLCSFKLHHLCKLLSFRAVASEFHGRSTESLWSLDVFGPGLCSSSFVF